MKIDWSNTVPSYTEVCQRISHYFKETLIIENFSIEDILFVFDEDLPKSIERSDGINLLFLKKKAVYKYAIFKNKYLTILNNGHRWIHFNILTNKKPYIASVEYDKEKNTEVGLATNFSYCILDSPYEIIID